jgi:FSR family fosmidomycin resistance protein-like MFS transporter
MAGRAGLASGLIMGLGFVSGAVGTPITGAVADHLGLQIGLGLQVLVVAVTIPIAMLLPTEAMLQSLRQRPAPTATPVVRVGSYSD